MHNSHFEFLESEYSRLHFECFSRTLIGYNGDFMTLTKGFGIYNHTFLEYRKSVNNDYKGRTQGVLVAFSFR